MSGQMKLDSLLLHELSSSSDPQKHANAALMIEKGADVNGLDAEGNSLLYVAVKSEAFVVIDAIIKRQTWGFCAEHLFDLHRNSIALAMRSPNAVELLTSLSERINYYDFKKYLELLPWDMPEDHLDVVVRALLQLSGQARNIELCIHSFSLTNRKLAELLIRCTTNMNKRMPLLEKCIVSGNEVERPTVTIALIIKEGAKIDEFVNDALKQYPLHLVCEMRDAITAQLLLHLGADANVTDRSGNTPFSMTCKNTYWEVTWEREFDNKYNNPTKSMIGHFACLNAVGKKVNEKDLLAIRENPMLQRYYDLCIEELDRMKTIEVTDGFPCYWFFSKTSYQLSLLLRDSNVCSQIKKKSYTTSCRSTSYLPQRD